MDIRNKKIIKTFTLNISLKDEKDEISYGYTILTFLLVMFNIGWSLTTHIKNIEHVSKNSEEGQVISYINITHSW